MVSALLLAIALCSVPESGSAYSVLTHQAIIDLSWNEALRPLLLARYPRATKAQLEEAHAYAYGGCAIQDAGYYPFSHEFFSDLTHYVRSGDFVEALLRNARNLNEYAFALGALSHYIGDSIGHADVINPATAIEYPKLAKKYGRIVTFEDAPRPYVATEFSFDIAQLPRHRFAPEEYQRFLGLNVPRHQLERAFYETYGLTMPEVLGKTGHAAVRSYRKSIRSFIPVFARAEESIHAADFPKQDPPAFAKVEPYLHRAPYLPDWAGEYESPGVGDRLLGWLIRILPPVGPVQYVKIRGPREDTEQLYYLSLQRTLLLYKRRMDALRLLPGMPMGLPNRDLDTGDWTRPGAYALTDRTYARLLHRIVDEKEKHPVPPGLKQDIQDYYAVPDAPITTKRDHDAWARVQQDLATLRATPARDVPAEGLD